jgi:hypothetical protein
MDAEILFDSINLEKIESFIAESTNEGLHLEFKSVNSTDLAKKEDRRNYSKSMSAFANSAGGIIVWGIGSCRQPDGSSCLEKSEIENLQRLIQRLHDLEAELIDPPISGIRHKEIQTEENRGYAATLVPASEGGPHIAKAKDQNRYYKRSGNQSLHMEHYEIERMFGTSPRPQLELNVSCRSSGKATKNGVPYSRYSLTLSLLNNGRGLAKYAFVQLKAEPIDRLNLCHDQVRPGMSLLKKNFETGIFLFSAFVDQVIHPTVQLDFTEFNIEVRDGSFAPSIQFSYELMAENMKPKISARTVTDQEIRGGGIYVA